MIAMKREVAAGYFLSNSRLRRRMAGFPWSECQVRKLATSHCITRVSLQEQSRVQNTRHTRRSVQSPLVVLK